VIELIIDSDDSDIDKRMINDDSNQFLLPRPCLVHPYNQPVASNPVDHKQLPYDSYQQNLNNLSNSKQAMWMK
jgi:hypothetical protein